METTELARVLDALRGGTSSFQAGRRIAEQVEARWPGAAKMVGWHDRFCARAAAEAVAGGAAGVIFGGAGYPAPGDAPHRLAAQAGDAWLGYPDADVIIVEKRALSLRAAGDKRACAFEADLRAPAGLLRAAREAGLPGGPVQVQWGLNAGLMTGAEAAEALRGYREELAPGSAIVLSVAPAGGMLAGAHQARDVTRWCAAAGLELAGPVKDVREWWRDWEEDDMPARGLITGAVAVVP